MDKAILINELKRIFAALNQSDKRYSKAWLTDMDFGGLYRNGKYVLHLVAEHKLNGYKSEFSFLLDLLDEKLCKEKASYVYHIKLYDENEEVYIEKDAIILYNDEVSYNAA